MTKKDYERAAEITQAFAGPEPDPIYNAVCDAFACLFREDGNPRFDEARFRRACVPGANVRARGKG